LFIYWNILTMHGPMNVKSPNNTSKWQMGFNSAFKGLNNIICSNLCSVESNINEWRNAFKIMTTNSEVI